MVTKEMTQEGLKLIDDRKPDDNDDWETPNSLFSFLCKKYNIEPKLDVCASDLNHKVDKYFTKETDALKQEWPFHSWCNPPHSKTEAFVRKAYREHLLNHIDIIMIIPTRCMSARFWFDCIEGKAEYHPIQNRIHFKRNGRDIGPAMQAYVCVIWCVRLNSKPSKLNIHGLL